jgi:hypothetical protein
MGFSERIDEDEDAETGDTRIRVEPGDHGTYKLYREKYNLVEFETDLESDDGEGFERYDWSPEDTFVLHSENEAEQVAKMLAGEGAFDPNVTFFRQREFSDPQQ